MNGIGGIWQRTGKLINSETWNALTCVFSDSPNYRYQEHLFGEIGLLSCLRRSTLEALLEKHSPINKVRDLVIVADARLDNRLELLDLLQLENQTDVSDGQIILAAYQAWQEACPQRLLGDFAFVIWDRYQDRLFCARDHFGVKPFYYYASRQIFVFGSAVRVLLTQGEVLRHLNEDKIADFMLELFEDKARTFYQDIFRLPPAHLMVVTRENISLSRYWELDPEKEIILSSDAEYAEAYRELFVEAVRYRLRGSDRIGSTLSGGLDSSSVTCVAGKLLEDESRILHTVSAVFDSVPQCDESEYIWAVLGEGHYEPHFAAGDQVNPIADLIEFMAGEEEPYYSPQAFVNHSIWKVASEHGIQVLLEGLMGDNVVSHGYPLLNELGYQWRWISLYRQFRALARNHINPQKTWRFMARAFWRDGIKPHIPNSVVKSYREVLGWDFDGTAEAVPGFFNPEYVRRIHLEERMSLRMAERRTAKTARYQHYLDLEYGLIPTAMEIYASHSSRYDIEPRFPFLDRRLAEFCLAIPAEQKLKDGYSRHVARLGLEGYLPDDIRWRSSKADLSLNFWRGLMADRSPLEKVQTDIPEEMEAFFDIPAIGSMITRTIEGKVNQQEAFWVFLIVSLIFWFQNGGVNSSFHEKEAQRSNHFHGSIEINP